ncbi:MAG: hypothetical protein FJW14_01765 [Acidimicrobiia bacterium]|nr:hypothetical protein [Acidimicrobiia bacterium]
MFLLRALRIVVRADSDPVRQALFANLRQSSLPVRIVHNVHERLGRTALSGLLVSLYGLAFFLFIAPPRRRGAQLLTVARHANARRQVARVAAWAGADQCGAVDVSPRALLGRYAWPRRPLHRFMQALRVIRIIDRRHGFLVSGYITPESTVAPGILISTRSFLPPLAALPIRRPYLAAAVEDARARRSADGVP